MEELKKINKTVLVLGIIAMLLACILMLLAIRLDSEKLFSIADYIPYFSGIIIFIYYVSCDRFDIKNYIGFVLVSKGIGYILEKIALNSIYEFILKNNHMKYSTKIIFILILSGTIFSIINSILYQLVKNSSRKIVATKNK
ncbi:hypothetical protein [Fusobacterium ulcerans]|uniref:hypothetical protein n=1 Tax=Fusobacterium ulcerans TaxID=861 RepID=UPI002670D7E6|nr:hypothetical protein [Fusobacterium ulcerans]